VREALVESVVPDVETDLTRLDGDAGVDAALRDRRDEVIGTLYDRFPIVEEKRTAKAKALSDGQR
jgi:ABC-type branched-subunit amino acid transport system ATPase component